MTYYTGPKTLRNKLNEWFAKQNHIKLPKNAISKLYVSVAEAWTPANLFPTGTEQGLFLDFADASSLYLTNKFQTNVSAYGDPVGGVLDKSQGLVLGAEKLTNGGFDTDLTGWTAAAGFSVSGGKLIGATSGDKIYQAAGITAGEVYSFTITGVVGEWGVRLGQDAANDYTITADGTYFITPGTLYSTTDFRLRVNIAGSELASISVKKLSGNHLIQATSTARPIWTRHPKSGVRNLLDASEDYSNAAWVAKVGLVSGRDDPAGGTSAYSVENTTGSSQIVLRHSCATTLLNEGTITAATSIWIRRRVGTGAVTLSRPDNSTLDVTASVTSAWTRIETTASYNSAFAGYFILRLSVLGDSVDVWHPQFEKSASATAYQTRVSKYDVTEAGVDDCYGLTFDGVDDYMQTAANLDLSGTQHSTFTAGYAATPGTPQMLLESPNNDTPTGSYYAFHQASNVPQISAKGTSGTAFAVAPSSQTVAVFSGLYDMSTPSLTARANGASGTPVGSATGGQLVSGLLYIGSRGGASLRLGGTIYGVTLTDYTLDAEQLAALETWTAARTPEVTLA